MQEIPSELLEEGLNYREMWATLRNELIQCCYFGVPAIHPYVIIGYMRFMYQLAVFDKKIHADES